MSKYYNHHKLQECVTNLNASNKHNNVAHYTYVATHQQCLTMHYGYNLIEFPSQVKALASQVKVLSIMDAIFYCIKRKHTYFVYVQWM